MYRERVLPCFSERSPRLLEDAGRLGGLGREKNRSTEQMDMNLSESRKSNGGESNIYYDFIIIIIIMDRL